ncbi:MAG: hypothetical protein QNJ40_05585 [Xanthomonadales bacterium]|nr:hypothetical protein [Xanthomonadales bacterium]
MKTFPTFILLVLSSTAFSEQLGTAFTYQGTLQYQGQPANGIYDLQFDLFDADIGGLAVVAPVFLDDVVVEGGAFSVELDYGTAAFAGDQLWIEIAIREGSNSGGYTGLLPRQKLTAQPYALHAEMVAVGAVGIEEIDPSEVQARIDRACPDGSLLKAVAADGGVTCETDLDTTYTAGAGLTLDGNQFSVASNQIQSRVTGTCARGSSIRSIGSDGAVNCETDDFNTNAGALTEGTLGTGRFDAYADLLASDRLDNRGPRDILTREQADGRFLRSNLTDLSVPGSVTAASFTLESPRTFKRNVSPISFINNGLDWRLSSDGAYRYCDARRDFPGIQSSVAALQLPAGSVVQRFSCYFRDNDSDHNIQPLTATLVTRGVTGTDVKPLASVTTSSTGASDNVRTATTTEISRANIISDAMYWVQLDFGTTICGRIRLQFRGCSVEYTRSDVVAQ